MVFGVAAILLSVVRHHPGLHIALHMLERFLHSYETLPAGLAGFSHLRLRDCGVLWEAYSASRTSVTNCGTLRQVALSFSWLFSREMITEQGSQYGPMSSNRSAGSALKTETALALLISSVSSHLLHLHQTFAII